MRSIYFRRLNFGPTEEETRVLEKKEKKEKLIQNDPNLQFCENFLIIWTSLYSAF